jgi:uncharacterized SAM-binding protein YcdF (DUF218 family)
MFFLFSKILGFVVSPYLWLFVLLLLATFSKARRKMYVIITLVIFFLMSNPFLFNEVARKWETPSVKLNDIGHYDYAIVLGGFSSYDTTIQKLKLNEAGDRIWQALQLYGSGKVDKILISGGSGRLLHQDQTEADRVKAFLISLHIPEKDIVMEMTSRNTHENALYTSEWLQKHAPGARCLLVTSAWHMPRALGCFQKAEISVVPYSSHFFSEERKYDPDVLLLPQASVLSNWGILIREWVGYATYKMMKYIK